MQRNPSIEMAGEDAMHGGKKRLGGFLEEETMLRKEEGSARGRKIGQYI